MPMSHHVTLTRQVALPSPRRVACYQRAPELGPSIVFFSGGTALRPLSRCLKHYTHNSVHIITPFDSGGSSAQLRRSFGMLSVGDLRNRLMALADDSLRGNPELTALFTARLPTDQDQLTLARQLEALVSGDDPRIVAVPQPMRQLVRTHLRMFAQAMPPSFDLRGASLGNLVLTGGYLSHDRDIHSVLYMFGKLVEARGIVRPVNDDDLHLAATLEDGSVIVGQHAITAKTPQPHQPQRPPPIRKLTVIKDLGPGPVVETSARACPKTLKLIRKADLLVYPMGSFFTSVLANLLPEGVGRTVCATPCPKVYIPNTGHDSEARGHSVVELVQMLIAMVRADAGSKVPVAQMLDAVVLDSDDASYAKLGAVSELEQLGVRVVRLPLRIQRSEATENDGTTSAATSATPIRLSAQRLTEVLVSMA